VVGQRQVRSARAPTPLGTLRKTRSQIEPGICRGKAGHRRAGQAFELVESGVVDGATANSSPRTARAINRRTRSSRRSPSLGAACGFWIKAWGQRGPALQGTGRLSNPDDAAWLRKGGLDVLTTHFHMNLCCIEYPIRTLGRCAWSRARRVGALRLVQFVPLVERAAYVVHQRIEQNPGHSAVPCTDVRPFVEAANSCSTRTVRRRDG
jgi:hypothetical protein